MKITTTAAMLLTLAYGSSAVASQSGVLRYLCDIGGVDAELISQYEIVGSTGITGNRVDGITGVIGTGDYTIYYQGKLTSPNASYVFVGENQFADFTDLSTNARFRVQFTAQGNQLLMTANPFGQQPARYLCRAVGT
jgi:hypothetical protein